MYSCIYTRKHNFYCKKETACLTCVKRKFDLHYTPSVQNFLSYLFCLVFVYWYTHICICMILLWMLSDDIMLRHLLDCVYSKRKSLLLLIHIDVIHIHMSMYQFFFRIEQYDPVFDNPSASQRARVITYASSQITKDDPYPLIFAYTI